MTSLPTISVITPSYNQGRYIERTIDSVLSQGYPNLEFIVIDGGSTDETVSILQRHSRHLAHWESTRDRGQSHAINKGMARATGGILAWINSDDWYCPGALNRFAELFAAHPEADFVVGAGRIVGASGEQIYYKEPVSPITLESLFQWMDGHDFIQPSSAFTRQAWTLGGPIDESVHISLDVDLWIRMCKAGVKFVTTKDILSEALGHDGAKTTAFKDLMRVDCALTIIRHGGEQYVRERLENMAIELAWFRGSYNALVWNPAVRIPRAIFRRLMRRKPDDWRNYLPPWRGKK